MGIYKASSINLRVNLKSFANTHKTSIRQGINDSIAQFGIIGGALYCATKSDGMLCRF